NLALKRESFQRGFVPAAKAVFSKVRFENCQEQNKQYCQNCQVDDCNEQTAIFCENSAENAGSPRRGGQISRSAIFGFRKFEAFGPRVVEVMAGFRVSSLNCRVSWNCKYRRRT